METKDLCGRKFIGRNGAEYSVLAGCLDGPVVFERCNNADEPLGFCCDAKILEDKLYGIYNVSYTVTKKEFYMVIDRFSETEKIDINSISKTLKKKYYKIPIIFLKLVGLAYLREREAI